MQREQKAMSKPTFLNSLNSKYILGKELNLLPLELFHLVKAGSLHPLDDNGEPILNPDVQIKLDSRKNLEKELRVMPLRYGTLETGKVFSNRAASHYDKEQEKSNLDNKNNALLKELEDIKSQLAAISDFTSWASFELPEDKRERQSIYNLLLRAKYKTCDTKKENSNSNAKVVAEEPTPTATKTAVPKESSLDIRAKELLTNKQTEEIIKAMTVIRVSDTEIIIKHGNEEITATCGDMGFKSNAKPWLMFMSILQDRNNQYFIGRYDKVNPKNNDDYRRKAKLFGNFSKKFIEFINYKFSLSLPRSFNVFENLKHLEGDGMYRPKFRVDEHQKSNQQVYLKNLSKDGTLAKLEDLFAKHKCEKDKSAKDHLLNEISKLAAHAKQNNWAMPETIAEAFLGTVTDVTPNLDALEISDYIDEVTKKDRYQL